MSKQEALTEKDKAELKRWNDSRKQNNSVQPTVVKSVAAPKIQSVNSSLLTVAEMVWLDAYHARVAEALMPLVDEKTGAWLKAGTLPLQ